MSDPKTRVVQQSAVSGNPFREQPITKDAIEILKNRYGEAPKETRKELAADAAMLARQCDLAREAETRAVELKAANAKLRECQNGIKNLLRKARQELPQQAEPGLEQNGLQYAGRCIDIVLDSLEDGK